MQCVITEKQSNQINTLLCKKKRAHESQIVRAKDNLKVSHARPYKRQALVIKPTDERFTPGPSLSLRPYLPSVTEGMARKGTS